MKLTRKLATLVAITALSASTLIVAAPASATQTTAAANVVAKKATHKRGSVTVGTIKNRSVAHKKTIALKPVVKTTGKSTAKVASKKITVKQGKKTVARNVNSAKLRAGTYRVTTTVKFKVRNQNLTNKRFSKWSKTRTAKKTQTVKVTTKKKNLGSVTVKNIKNRSVAKKSSTSTVKPNVTVKSAKNVKVSSSKITVKQGKKTVARNVNSRKLKPGTYRVTTTVKFKVRQQHPVTKKTNWTKTRTAKKTNTVKITVKKASSGKKVTSTSKQKLPKVMTIKNAPKDKFGEVKFTAIKSAKNNMSVADYKKHSPEAKAGGWNNRYGVHDTRTGKWLTRDEVLTEAWNKYGHYLITLSDKPVKKKGSVVARIDGSAWYLYPGDSPRAVVERGFATSYSSTAYSTWFQTAP